MTATILDGAALAESILSDLAAEVAEMAKVGVQPGLGTILVGDDVSSARYVALKHEDCAKVGIASVGAVLPADCSQEDLLSVVHEFNENPAIDAYLLQLPIPKHLDEEAALLAMDPKKDADGLHPINLGRLVMGAPGPLPCTPAGIVKMLSAYDVPVEGRHVVIIGRGITIGRPLALLLALRRPGCNAAVTVLHTGVHDLGPYLATADVVIAAAGSPGIVTKEMVKPGAAVIGAGTTFVGRKLLPDVEEDVAEVAGYISPRLGGVGPMTRAMLLSNAVVAARPRPEPGVVVQISDLIAAGPTLSVELWPARSPEAALRLEESLARLEALRPSFASITYGAAGSTRDRTHELVMQIQRRGLITPMAHLVTAAHRRSDLLEILQRYAAGGITNVLALHGDPPLDGASELARGELEHAIDLVELAKSVGGFCVAVAAHPEGHPLAPDLATDRRHLAAKLSLADFAITQFFFRVEDYLALVEDLSALGVNKPVIPGIMPITNVRSLAKMAELAGCELPSSLTERVFDLSDAPEELSKLGVQVATDLCEKLLAEGVPGLHFYTMNQLSATLKVCENLGL